SMVYQRADNSQILTYGEIVANHQGEWSLPETTPSLKPNADFQYIGRPIQRVDFHEKVTGRAIYGLDARVEGMRYGAVARPPRYGAELTNATVGDAESQPGVVAVVIQDGFAGIVAETRAQAHTALTHLNLTWEGGTTWSQDDLEATMFVPDTGGTLVQRAGNFASLPDEDAVFESEYFVPMASHAHLEPQSALVDAREDSAIVYCSTQAPNDTRAFVARALGLNNDAVNVRRTYIGGGFGRKLGIPVAVEAARLSQASGFPVHVGWTREEEMRYGFHRPPSRQRLQAILSDNRQLQGLHHQIASGDIMFGSPNVPAPDVLAALLGADPLALTRIEYGIPNILVRYYRKDLPIPTGSWRGLGTLPNTFSVESFIDELAHRTDIDPLEMRLNHLSDNEFGQRQRAVLEAVADVANWGNPPQGHAYGLALGHLGTTVVALIADVSTQDTRFTVHRIWCAVDAGLVVNPDGARAQVEGTIVMALGSCLREELTIQDGMMVASNFGQYPLPTIRDTPEIEVIFVESSDEPIGGLGEAVIGVVAPAIGNAIFVTSGQRLRRLPFQLA
ncbi:MAG: molybdopterin cofactor-binding domain-containing protein, partial [Chloroflexota bacterium]